MTKGSHKVDLPDPGSLLFAYGTLQRGGEYHFLMQNSGATFIGNGKTATAYPLLLDQYPCLIDEPGSGYQVEGEIYRLPNPENWKPVDRLEGHPIEYRRRIEKIICQNEPLEAWAYFYLHPGLLRKGLSPVRRFSAKT